jgi:flagellar biosynthetic protein FliO
MELARSLTGVAILFGLLGVLLWIARKKGTLAGLARSRSGGRMLEIVERVSLTGNHSVHLLRVGDRVLLVGVSSSGLTLLCDVSEPRPARS